MGLKIGTIPQQGLKTKTTSSGGEATKKIFGLFLNFGSSWKFLKMACSYTVEPRDLIFTSYIEYKLGILANLRKFYFVAKMTKFSSFSLLKSFSEAEGSNISKNGTLF